MIFVSFSKLHGNVDQVENVLIIVPLNMSLRRFVAGLQPELTQICSLHIYSYFNKIPVV